MQHYATLCHMLQHLMFAHWSPWQKCQKSIRASKVKKENKAFPVYRLGNQLIVTLKWFSFGFGFGSAFGFSCGFQNAAFCDYFGSAAEANPYPFLPQPTDRPPGHPFRYQFKTTYCADFLHHSARVFGFEFGFFHSCLQKCSNMPRNVTVYNCQTCSVILTLHTTTTAREITTTWHTNTGVQSVVQATFIWLSSFFLLHVFQCLTAPFCAQQNFCNFTLLTQLDAGYIL